MGGEAAGHDRDGRTDMVRLSTHVLDAVNGVPTRGVGSALYALDDAGGRRLLKEATSNEGRTAEPLLSGASWRQGYEIVFLVGEYFRAKAGRLTGPSFLEDVPVRFAIADTGAQSCAAPRLAPVLYDLSRELRRATLIGPRARIQQ
jgi:5-hydroxyisourate hydrolase